ncbi:MAG TPA: PilN domain-containing protein [Rhodocyclaceae bacterium]|nr:PilN domain-containing protein [Rhodocyclaceae bacterium]
MSAQINLYHPRYRLRQELLTLLNLVLATVALYGVLILASVWLWRQADERQQLAAAKETQHAALKASADAALEAVKARKPNSKLQAEAEQAEAVQRRREEIVALLESGAVGSSTGFAEYFRSLARQAPHGLWLTGLSIGHGGHSLEIRGSMLDAAALPDYLRRLNTEKAFQGRSFAALTMTRPTPSAAANVALGVIPDAPLVTTQAGAAPMATVSPAPTFAAARAKSIAPTPIDFVLSPAAQDGGAAAKAKP